MVSRKYDGRAADADRHVMRRIDVDNLLGTATTRDYALDRINTLALPYAPKTYVDAADATFAAPSYMTTRDALNIPLTAKGVPNGVASLDSSGDIPLGQMPNFGSGLCRGPYGAMAGSLPTSDVNANTVPLQIAQIDLGIPAINFKPLAFFSAIVLQTPNTSDVTSRAILEMRIGTTTQTTYPSQRLISAGYGNGNYPDFQTISTLPCGDTTGQTPSSLSFSPSTHWLISVWMYAVTGTVSLKLDNVVLCSAFLTNQSS